WLQSVGIRLFQGFLVARPSLNGIGEICWPIARQATDLSGRGSRQRHCQWGSFSPSAARAKRTAFATTVSQSPVKRSR
ncbi:hypothetical protein CWN69_29245, partial [Klebsiella quasipneumoniae]